MMSAYVNSKIALGLHTLPAMRWNKGKKDRNWGALKAGCMIFRWRWWSSPAYATHQHSKVRGPKPDGIILPNMFAMPGPVIKYPMKFWDVFLV